MQEQRNLGNWIVQHPASHPVWRGWLVLRLSGAESTDLRWGRLVDAATLEFLKPCRPSLRRAMRLAQFNVSSLQRVDIPERLDDGVLVTARPVDGEPIQGIVDWPEWQDLSQRRQMALQIVGSVAQALSALHKAGIVHGRVLPDRILWDGQQPVLAVDPLCTATTPVGAVPTGLLQEELAPWVRWQFIAPEFLAPGQQPTCASDVYSLGCMWWLLMFGQPPVVATEPKAALAAHCKPLPDLPLPTALEPPLVRVLQHALGRQPESRFANATEFAAALARAQQMVESPRPRGKRVQQRPEPHRAQAVVKPKAERSSERPSTESRATAPATNPRAPSSATSAETKRRPRQRHPHAPEQPRESMAAKSSNPTAPEVPGPPVDDKAKSPAFVVKAPVPQTVQPAAARQPATPVATQPQVARKRRKRNNAGWLIPVAGGCGFIAVLLLVLKFSGALDAVAGGSRKNDQQAQASGETSAVAANANQPRIVRRDPLEEMYRVVDGDPTAPWLPPAPPRPIPLDLLPPGGQIFVSLDAARLLTDIELHPLREPFAESLQKWRDAIQERIGVPLESTQRILVAYYTPAQDGAFPEWVVRVQLQAPTPLTTLRGAWQASSAEQSELAYYTAGQWGFVCQPNDEGDAATCDAFAVGPVDRMREAVEMGGAAGPLVRQIEQLHKISSEDLDVTVLVAVPFLFGQGRGMLHQMPPRAQDILRQVLGREAGAALLQTQFSPQWYIELDLVGTSSVEAGRLLGRVQDAMRSLPNAVEQWFVKESPHPYWRALALRYPQMLRALFDHARFGIEDSIAVVNAYLPRQAAPNLLMATWIALQDAATLAGDLTPETTASTPQPLTIDEYLSRPIRVVFDQEPIETALQLIQEEAADGLPPGNTPLRFELDGDAFEKGGITRNQQLREFRIENAPVRDALTLLARKGNPVTTVTDTRDPDQRLIWVVKDDPENPGKKMISLTTRAAATEADIPLPEEFAPAAP